MKRTLTIAAVSAAFLVAPGCKKDETKADGAAEAAKDGEGEKAADGEEKAEEKAEAEAPAAAAGGSNAVEALAFFPEGTFFVGTADLGMLKLLPGFSSAMVESAIEDPKAREAVRTFRECGVDIMNLTRVSFGVAEKDKAMVVMDGTGISKRSNLECVVAAVAKADPPVNLSIEEADGLVKITGMDKSTGYAIGDDRLVIANAEAAELVEPRVKGEGSSASEGSLKAALALADTSKKVFAVMGGDSEATKELAGTPLEGVTGMAMWIEGSDKELSMEVKMGMPDAAKATAGKDFLSTQFDQQVKPLAPMIGIPATVVEKVKFAAAESVVTIGMALDEADMKLLQQLSQQMGAGAAGGMPGGAPGGMPGGM